MKDMTLKEFFDEEESLLEYEGPILYTLRYQGQLYLVVAVDYFLETQQAKFMAAPVSDQQVADLKAGKITSRSVYDDAGQVWIITQGWATPENTITVVEANIADIPEDDKPTIDSYIANREEA